jgi:hypothetical protein
VGQETGLETYTLWARDPGGTPDHVSKGGSSLYGSHPLYMQLSKQVGGRSTDYSMQLSSRCNFQNRSAVDQQVFVKANLVWTIRLCGTDKFRESALVKGLGFGV